MSVELKIRWDGNVPGLADHRLSIGAFGEALPLLLAAARRIATQIVQTATEGEAPETGRFANLARILDIEIVSIEGNSTGVNALVSFQGGGANVNPAFLDLPTRTTTALLDAIASESDRRPANSAVRKYLRMLPGGLREQVYEVFEGGASLKRVELKDVSIAELPEPLPAITQYEGVVLGVGFEPGKYEVRIKTDSNTTFILLSPPEAVDRAIEYRNQRVRALCVQQDERRGRLLMLNRATDPPFQFSPEQVETQIFRRWDTLLRELAK